MSFLRMSPTVIATLGFGIFLTLGSTSAWGLITLVHLSGIAAADLTAFETFRSTGFIATLFSFGFGCLYLNGLFNRNTTVPSTITWMLGYAGLFAFSSCGQDAQVLLGCSAVLVGMAHALSLVAWQRVMASMEPMQANRTIVLGTALGGLLYLALSFVQQVTAYGVAVFALIVLNAAFLKACTAKLFDRAATPPADGLLIARTPGAGLGGLASSIWRSVLCVATVGYVSGVTRVMARSTQTDALLLNTLLAAGMLVAAILLLWLGEGLHRSFTFKGAYVVIFFGIITGFLLLPFMASEYRAVFAGIANLAFTLVSMFMMLTCLRIARLRNLDPIAVFGLFAGSVYLCVLVGRLVGAAFGEGLDVAQLLVVALLSIYVLSFSGAIVGMIRGTGEASDFDPILGDTRTLPDGGATSEPKDAPVPTPSTPLMPDAAQEAQEHVMTRRVVVVQDMVPSYCSSLKRDFKLSNREADVLELIVRGRDVAHMAETLYVSENTVRSHCKNLYRKLGVHNRQQVLDLLEAQREKDEGRG